MKSRRMRKMGLVSCTREKRNAYRNLVEKPKGNRPLAGPWRLWEDNTEVDLEI
jgi:hypothetical protein